jgi:hypothetical protein
MTSSSIPLDECVALAYRVSGDPWFVNWVRSDPSDKTIGRHFDSLHALAKCLLHEMKAAGHVVRASSGGYGLANPNNGRFQSLKKKLKSDWLPQAQGLDLAEYLENLFVRERGAIRREHIEQINLALADAAHRANGSDSAIRSPNVGMRGPGRPGDKLSEIHEQMSKDIKDKSLTLDALSSMKQKELAAKYGAARATVVKARKKVLDESRRESVTN